MNRQGKLMAVLAAVLALGMADIGQAFVEAPRGMRTLIACNPTLNRS
jgi:hypothetical protein